MIDLDARPVTTPAADLFIALDVFSPGAYKIYAIKFANQELALAWIKAHAWEPGHKGSYVTGEAYNAWREDAQDKSEPLDGCRWVDADLDPELYAYLYPTCEHGMSGLLCSGPNHFGEPGDERYN